MPTEADTCHTYITPALQTAGWESGYYSIAEQRTFTDGLLAFINNEAASLQKEREWKNR
jgi:hypothetical protein